VEGEWKESGLRVEESGGKWRELRVEGTEMEGN